MAKELKSHFGLTGRHGFVKPGVHVNANYDCNDKFFMNVPDRLEEELQACWVRVPENELQQYLDNGYTVIKCHCGNPAVTIDHSYPWQQESVLCAEHYGKENN